MTAILDLSAKIIDTGAYEGPNSVNRTSGELSELARSVAFIEAFSNVVTINTDDGLVLFDTSLDAFAPKVIQSLRGWSGAPVHTMAYTHGHIDHVGGASAFVDEARDKGHRRPRVVAHEHVPPRFDRYRMTNGYNAVINDRQFRSGAGRKTKISGGMSAGRFGPQTWIDPDTTFDDRMNLNVGGVQFHLRHDKGETDDHLWAWIPEHKAIVAGDFVIWVFPNAGNPQKVQRYPAEWARALRQMIAHEPELLLPAHGLPVQGKARIATMLGDMADALEFLVENALRLMNQGAKLDDIIHSVKLPQGTLDKPYMRPVYDEPEFVLRNIWRLYGGWYDGNPARLKPAKDAHLANEIAHLAGGAGRLAKRAQELAGQGEMRLACHLVEMAADAEPTNKEVHAARRDIYRQRREGELSLMAKGIFGAAAEESDAKLEG